MNILELSKVAIEYYDSSKPKFAPNGYDKWVATDGVHSIFVDANYRPSEYEAVFNLSTKNGKTICQLKKTERREHYTLTPMPQLRWKLTNNYNGISVVFMDGCFEATRHIDKASISVDHLMSVDETVNGFRTFLQKEHGSLYACDLNSRLSVIKKLDDYNYWMALAVCLNGFMMPGGNRMSKSFILGSEIIDSRNYGLLDEWLTEEQYENLKNKFVITDDKVSADDSLVTDKEANEVFSLVASFWESGVDVAQWAKDVLWLPKLIKE